MVSHGTKIQICGLKSYHYTMVAFLRTAAMPSLTPDSEQPLPKGSVFPSLNTWEGVNET